MKRAFLFPGQGAHSAGMGGDVAGSFPSAMAVFDRANDILGMDIKTLCFEGPQEKLDSTDISQPAIFTASAAILEVIGENTGENFTADVTAGLSMGEYTALYAAGIISFEDGLKLVRERGLAMQEAAERSKGSMVSIIGLDEEKVNALCEKASQGRLLKPANFNCPGQIVISGEVEACQRAVELAPEFEAIKAVPLSVAGAFHTEMMSPAAERLEKALNETEIQTPGGTKIISNVDTDYYPDPAAVRKGLVRQLVEPILWQKCMEKLLAEGVTEFYEIGPGRVLTGLMKRINRKMKVTNVSDEKTLKSLLSQAAA